MIYSKSEFIKALWEVVLNFRAKYHGLSVLSEDPRITKPGYEWFFFKCLGDDEFLYEVVFGVDLWLQQFDVFSGEDNLFEEMPWDTDSNLPIADKDYDWCVLTRTRTLAGLLEEMISTDTHNGLCLETELRKFTNETGKGEVLIYSNPYNVVFDWLKPEWDCTNPNHFNLLI